MKKYAFQLRAGDKIIFNGRWVILDTDPYMTYGDNCHLSFFDQETKEDGQHQCSSKDEFEA